MNPFEIVKNLKNLEGTMNSMKEELAQISETGSSGGNIVQVTLNGKFEITAIKLDPIAVDPRDIQMLQDLIISAHHAAMEKIQERIQEKSGALLGGLKIPGMQG